MTKSIGVRIFRRARNELLYFVLKAFGPAFSDRKYSAVTLAKCAFRQKILRMNHNVPWPVHWTSIVHTVDKIDRGTRCPGLSARCHIDGRNGIIIGKNVWIGPGVSLISMNHRMDDFTKYVVDGPIIIGDNSWLGTNVIILPRVQLGNHVVVAAGSVVTKSFPEDNILIAGVPAQIIKQIGPYIGPSD